MYNLDKACNNILLNDNFKLTNLVWIELFNQYAKKNVYWFIYVQCLYIS